MVSRLSQPQRLGALNQFKAQSKKILVATDVASRGLDIPQATRRGEFFDYLRYFFVGRFSYFSNLLGVFQALVQVVRSEV